MKEETKIGLAMLGIGALLWLSTCMGCGGGGSGDTVTRPAPPLRRALAAPACTEQPGPGPDYLTREDGEYCATWGGRKKEARDADVCKVDFVPEETTGTALWAQANGTTQFTRANYPDFYWHRQPMEKQVWVIEGAVTRILEADDGDLTFDVDGIHNEIGDPDCLIYTDPTVRTLIETARDQAAGLKVGDVVRVTGIGLLDFDHHNPGCDTEPCHFKPELHPVLQVEVR